MRWNDSLRIYFADFWGTLAGKTWAIRVFSDLGMDGSKCLKLCRKSLHIHHWVLQNTMPYLPHMYGTWGRGWGGRETTWSMEPFLPLVGGQGRHTAKEKLRWWGEKRTSNDNSRVLQLAYELHSHSVQAVIFYARSSAEVGDLLF